MPAAPPNLLQPFAKAFRTFFGTAVYIFKRVHDVVTVGEYDCIPKPILHLLNRRPAAAFTRVERAMVWLEAVHQTMKGSREYLRSFGPTRAAPLLPSAARAEIRRLEAENRALRGLPAVCPPRRKPRPATESSRDLARRARIRRTLQRESIGFLIRRVCRGFAIDADHEAWPGDLVHLSETPEQFLLRQEKSRRAHFAAHPPPPVLRFPALLPLPRQPDSPPPYHPRE